MKKSSEHRPRAQTDAAWKEILRLYLKDFFELCWPTAYQEVDWDKSYELLEQELQVVGSKEELGTKIIDKLFKVYLKGGQEQWILCHLEPQGAEEEDFPERMYIYDYRIYDRYRRNIASLAILLDDDLDWRPKKYSRQIWGSETTRTYEILKILDFKERKAELMESSNPFALVILAQLSAIETAKNQKQRLVSKLELARYLHRHGWEAEQRRDLYLFLDLLLK